MKIGKEYKQIASQLLGCTLASYYNWDNQKHPIINLLEKYLTKEDLHEFLLKGEINKLERLEELLEIERKYKQILEITQNDFEERNAEFYIEKMLDYYSVTNMTELSPIIKELQPTISSWKIRNSITAVKKKCRRLGIYNEIFKN